ncbi:MAG: TIGR03000 domain-containing protein [Pirellulaceae bacterium]
MNRNMFRRMLVIGALVAAMTSVTATAQAGWGIWGGCCGHGAPALGWTGYDYSYYAGWGGGACCDYGVYRPAYVPVYTSYYADWCDPCYTPPRRGCFSRLLHGWRSHHYGYYANWHRPVWSVAVCCPTCGEYGVECGCGELEGDLYYGEPAIVPDATSPSPTPAVPPASSQDLPAGEEQTSLTIDSALLTVNLPRDARVLVNGLPTRSTGDMRRFVSRNLNPGFNYTYEVTAEATINGQSVAQTKTVHLRAGDQVELAFDLRTSASIETALTLHVPSDAKVLLAGNETRGSGPVRTFRTTKLDGGKTWAKYLVQVTVLRDGENLTKEQTITLRAGDQAELTFDFDGDKVAAAR